MMKGEGGARNRSSGIKLIEKASDQGFAAAKAYITKIDGDFDGLWVCCCYYCEEEKSRIAEGRLESLGNLAKVKMMMKGEGEEINRLAGLALIQKGAVGGSTDWCEGLSNKNWNWNFVANDIDKSNSFFFTITLN